MKDMLQKFKNLKNLPIFTMAFVFLVSYYWIEIYHFANPFPKKEFYGNLFLQFSFGFLPNLYSRRLGRIFVATGAMILVRLSAHTNSEFDIPVLNGLFFGAISGICLREIFLEFLGRNDPSISSKESDFFRRLFVLNPPPKENKKVYLDVQFSIIIFLVVLTLDRFITYFNAPYLKGFGILETMYLPEISSKTAFGLSMKTIDSLIFPLLYFFYEERTSPQLNPPQTHWLTGISIGLVANIVVIFSQTFYSLNIFSGHTNLSMEANRTMGLLRDSGSSSWILSTLLSVFVWKILNKKGEWRTVTKSFILIILTLIAILVGIKQGRAYWLIFSINFFVIVVILIFQKIKNTYLKISFFPIVFIVLGLYVLLLIYAGGKTSTENPIHKTSTYIKMFFNKETNLKSTIEKIDQNRITFSEIAIKVFSKNILFGNGVGSFIPVLHDKSYTENKKFTIMDSAPSLYLGLLSEVGLIGVVVILLWLITSTIGRKLKYLPLFLILPFFIGYQVVHPDGAFVSIFLILAISPNVKLYKKTEIISVILIYGFSVLFILHSLFKINKEGQITDFRYKELHSHQLLAYEKNKKGFNLTYHIFKGKTIWTLINPSQTKVTVFLDNSTSKTSLNQKWSLLDQGGNILESKNILVQKNSHLSIWFSNKIAKYIQVEELNSKNETRRYGDTPFCIPTTQFNTINQIQ